MIPHPALLSVELWRVGILIGVLIFYKSAYRLVARAMDCLTSTPSTATSTTHTKLPASSSHSSTSVGMSPFHRRLRSPACNSNSKTTSAVEVVESTPVARAEDSARSAKRFLLSTIRDDWNYPHQGDHEATSDSLCRTPVDHRRREDWSSDPEPLSDGSYDARDPLVFSDLDPYKFESPDAVAGTMTDRRRKRRRLLEEELEWNDGLRRWTECRNAWCGVVEQRAKRRISTLGQTPNGQMSSMTPDLSDPLSPLSLASATTSSSVYSGAEYESSDREEEPVEDGLMVEPDPNPDPMLPVYPPLLPKDNPIRASIKPATYPAIYSKVVLQGLTPTVPVPLPDMVGALIQGWKSEGNWPPKPAGAATSILQEGGRRASDLLKFRRRQSVVAEMGRMRKGVGAVKKALGMRSSGGEANGSVLRFERDGLDGKNETNDDHIFDEHGQVEGDGSNRF